MEARMPRPAPASTAMRPIHTCLSSLVSGRNLRTKSRTAMVDMEFMIASSEDMSAARSDERSRPRSPTGSRLVISQANVSLVPSAC